MQRFFLFVFLICGSLFADFSPAILVKRHTDRASTFEDRPYGRSDVSYGLFMDLFDVNGAWRLGASYAGDVSGPGDVSRVITPEITLLATDGLWEAGVSALMDYTSDDDNDGWGDVYYQVQLGVNFPVSDRIQVGFHAFYPFDSFSNFSDIRSSLLDYGLLIRMKL